MTTDLIRDRLGIFSGSGESPSEIVSQVLIPYGPQRMPLQGGFLVVAQEDLQGRASGLLGRVTRAVPLGDLFTSAGEDYLVDMVRMGHSVPEEVKTGRLRYRISLRLLGQISREADGRIAYTPAIRQMPHVGAPVGFPTEEVTRFIAQGCPDPGEDPGAVIGHLAVGDLAFDGSEKAKGRNVPVHFRMGSLVGRRTAVFARAGMGKSNFTKVLLTRLYSSGEANIPGTLIVDPEGEYAFSNASEPGLLDVAALKERVVVFTDRKDFDSKYRSSVAGNCMVNFADLDPVEAVNNLLPEEKQNMVFANMLRSLEADAWRKLVRALEFSRYKTSHRELARIVGKRTDSESDVVMGAIINNLVPAIDRLHSSKSALLSNTREALRDGKIVILDVSMRTGKDAKLISAWILRDVFANNQEAYTSPATQEAGKPPSKRLIPCLALFEEAQFYLGDDRLREESTFVRWFKEGRKFKLGSILVTQQPGAIGPALISQCDNFFIFHLLNRTDLDALGTANLNYAGDIVNTIGHESIPGNCYLWSGLGLSFVTTARILHFGKLVEDEDNWQRPFDVVAEPARPASESIPLPVQDVRVGSDRADNYVLEALRRVIEQEERIFVFRVRSIQGAADLAKPCLSVVANYLIEPLNRQLQSDLNSGGIPGASARSFPVSALAVAKGLARLGMSPATGLLRDEMNQDHIVFHAELLAGGNRKPKGEVALG